MQTKLFDQNQQNMDFYRLQGDACGMWMLLLMFFSKYFLCRPEKSAKCLGPPTVNTLTIPEKDDIKSTVKFLIDFVVLLIVISDYW